MGSYITEIRVREELEYGRFMRYPNMDRNDQSRGDVGASAYRDMGNGKNECVAFLPGTVNNIANLLQRGCEVCKLQIGERGLPAWVQIDAGEYLAACFAQPANLPPLVPNPENAPESSEDDTGTQGGLSGELVIASVEDVLALKQQQQMEVVEAAPVDMLEALVAHPKTPKLVRSKAMAVLKLRKQAEPEQKSTAQDSAE